MTSADCTGVLRDHFGNLITISPPGVAKPTGGLRFNNGVLEQEWLESDFGRIWRAVSEIYMELHVKPDDASARGATLRYYQNALATTERFVEELREELEAERQRGALLVERADELRAKLAELRA